MQRRHTTAVGRKEAEAKKRKERDEKFAQSQGKAQAKGEDGDGMIGKENRGGSVIDGRREGVRGGRQGSDRFSLF